MAGGGGDAGPPVAVSTDARSPAAASGALGRTSCRREASPRQAAPNSPASPSSARTAPHPARHRWTRTDGPASGGRPAPTATGRHTADTDRPATRPRRATPGSSSCGVGATAGRPRHGAASRRARPANGGAGPTWRRHHRPHTGQLRPADRSPAAALSTWCLHKSQGAAGHTHTLTDKRD